MPNLLAIDTAANLCAACVWDTDAGAERGRAVLDLGKGHAEHLMTVTGEALAKAGIGYSDLGAVAVSVGPGSFTGVRVGVSAARGLSLALGVPAIGVTTLEAIAAEHDDSKNATLVVIDAGRDHVYAAVYQSFSRLRYGPVMIAFDDAVALAREGGLILAGSASEKVASTAGGDPFIASRAATADIAVYARIAAARGASADKPKPLYLRPPDAKPQASHVLARRPG